MVYRKIGEYIGANRKILEVLKDGIDANESSLELGFAATKYPKN